MLKGIFDKVKGNKSKYKRSGIGDDLSVYSEKDIEFLVNLLNTPNTEKDATKPKQKYVAPEKDLTVKKETQTPSKPTPVPPAPTPDIAIATTEKATSTNKTEDTSSKLTQTPQIKKLEDRRELVKGKYPSKFNNYSFRYIKSLSELRELSIDLSKKTCLEFDCKNSIIEKGLVCLYSSLIGYIYYDCLTKEQEYNSLIEMLNAMEYKKFEDSENAVDLIFEDLANENPEHFALRQYIMFSHLSYEQKSEIVFMANYYLNDLLCETGYIKYKYTKPRKAEIIDFTFLKQKSKRNLTKKILCDKCGAEMLLRESQKGDIQKFYSCSNYPKCRNVKPIK